MIRPRPSACVTLLCTFLTAFLLGRLTSPRPHPQPSVCPYEMACPFCRGIEDFGRGKERSDNPFFVQTADNVLDRGRVLWEQGWDAGQHWGDNLRQGGLRSAHSKRE